MSQNPNSTVGDGTKHRCKCRRSAPVKSRTCNKKAAVHMCTYLRPLWGSNMLPVSRSVTLVTGVTFRWSAFLLRISGSAPCNHKMKAKSAIKIR